MKPFPITPLFKVQYVGREIKGTWVVQHVKADGSFWTVCECYGQESAEYLASVMALCREVSLMDLQENRVTINIDRTCRTN